MPKNYFNHAVTGNSSLLGCFSEKGELIRLFWPNIDYPQHIGAFRAGLFFPDGNQGTAWLDSDEWKHCQRYLEDTNILVTECSNECRGLKVTQFDFAIPGEDVHVRRYEIENCCGCDVEIGFMHYSSGISTIPAPSGVMIEYGLEALIHYRHGFYYSAGSAIPAWKYQLGGDALNSAGSGVLKGTDNIGMMQDCAAAWKLGRLEPGAKAVFTLYICFSHTLKDLKKKTAEVSGRDSAALLGETAGFWRNRLKQAARINTGIREVDELYRRSVLVFALMSDKNTGGLLAAPEVDEEFTKCGRYAYCWGRDAAFITEALDKCGLSAEAGRFYLWAAGTQDEEGSWQQRFYMDGNLAPSWGIQIDETGSILWGMLKHFKATGDREFLVRMWECMRKGVEFLIRFIDPETGLPWLSHDLWEERLGEHAYSSAAVYGGIMAGAEAGGILGKPSAMLHRWREAANAIKSAVERNFWKPDRNRFIRSIRLKMNPWGEEYTNDRVWLQINGKGDCRDFTLESDVPDISLLGLSVPFGLYEANDPRIVNTADWVERSLSAGDSMGLLRYENDGYIGGNPWIISTLWASLLETERGEYEKARRFFNWAVSVRTGLGLLPEQVDRWTGNPAWVIPLTWSHAMFVLALFRLMDTGVLQNLPVPEDG